MLDEVLLEPEVATVTPEMVVDVELNVTDELVDDDEGEVPVIVSVLLVVVWLVKEVPVLVELDGLDKELLLLVPTVVTLIELLAVEVLDDTGVALIEVLELLMIKLVDVLSVLVLVATETKTVLLVSVVD